MPSYDRVRGPETPKPISDAALTDRSTGRVAFVLFGFTNCPDVCPRSMELQHSGQVVDNDVAYVMISRTASATRLSR